MERYDCIIIDSGVNCSHRELKNQVIHGFSISLNQMHHSTVSKHFQDKVGHGTAIYSIIKKYSPYNTSILNINIFNEKEQVDERLLIIALEYIYKNIGCKVINISMGLKMCDDISELYAICKRISDRGTLILSAFDNDGAISYPAAFDCVMGVDSSEDCVKISDYEYIENSVINIRAKGGYQKVPWLEPEYAIVQGSSFSCAYMCANILNILSGVLSWSISDIYIYKIERGCQKILPIDFEG